MKKTYQKGNRAARSGFAPKPQDFWGFSMKHGKIGFAEVRRALPTALFRRVKKKRPLFVYEWTDAETGFRMEVETALNPKNGLLHIGFGNPVFIVRHYDLRRAPPVANATGGQADDAADAPDLTGEVTEWRSYIEEDASFLLELRRAVGAAYRLHERRPRCCAEDGSVYAAGRGFVCPKCGKVAAVPAAYDFSEAVAEAEDNGETAEATATAKAATVRAATATAMTDAVG